MAILPIHTHNMYAHTIYIVDDVVNLKINAPQQNQYTDEKFCGFFGRALARNEVVCFNEKVILADAMR